LTIGLVIAGGYVMMARAADTGWPSAMVTGAAVALMRPPLIPRSRYSRGAITDLPELVEEDQ
jgi:hypothetical protein